MGAKIMQYIHWLGPVELDPQAEYVLTQSIARAILAEGTRLLAALRPGMGIAIGLGIVMLVLGGIGRWIGWW